MNMKTIHTIEKTNGTSHFRRFLTSFNIQEMQNKTTLRYHFPPRLAKIIKFDNTPRCPECGKIGIQFLWKATGRQIFIKMRNAL